MLIMYVCTNDQLADILTKEYSPRCNDISLLSLWQIRRPYETCDVRSFSRKPFSCSGLEKPQAMSQMMTQATCVDQMWDQYSSKVLKSGCILGNLVTLEQLGNHEFTCAQDKRDLLAGGVLVSDLARQKRFVRQLVQSTVICRKCTRQNFTSFQTLFYAWESKRWTCQKSNSTKGGMSISSSTGNPQGK